jgi:hypothetical protein
MAWAIRPGLLFFATFVKENGNGNKEKGSEESSEEAGQESR